MSTLTPMDPAGRILDGRLIPVEGDPMMEAATMSLSTPIASTQDGPRMTGFAGKKAAPFVKGGGRSSKHPNDAKGRKRKAAKAALAKAKGQDYSNIDLAFGRHDVTSEPRGTDGRWIRAARAATTPGQRAAVRRGSFNDYSNLHITSHEEHSKVLDILDSADAAAKRSPYNDPTWTPEKGPRGPAEAKYLAAKNMLAQATLAGQDKAIKRYHGKVAKARVEFEAERAKGSRR